jgi:hypothetical protein
LTETNIVESALNIDPAAAPAKQESARV